MRLFPEGVEVRILALEHRAHTGGDIVVFVPDEKVLLTGDLYGPARFPDIDSEPGEGSAQGWIDGIRQVIRWVPLLKSAEPEPKPDPEEPPEEEKTLEELVTVIPGRGPISNLQEVKDLYDLARGLRTAAGRAIKAGRTLKRFLTQGSLAEHRSMANFQHYASELYNALANE
jgi:glyoxylase-like metal-dependent hydrolase (beta-lactamase superfamily II)